MIWSDVSQTIAASNQNEHSANVLVYRTELSLFVCMCVIQIGKLKRNTE